MVSAMDDGAGEGPQRRRRGRPKTTGLSEREWQVAWLAAAGLSRDEIGARLHLSRWTVKGHLAKIHAKIELNNPRDRAELRRRLGDLEAGDDR